MQAHEASSMVPVPSSSALPKAFRDPGGVLDTLFATNPLAVMVTDDENRIIAVNAAFCQMTGYAEREVLGVTPAILQSGLHDTAFYRVMWNTLTEFGRWAGEIWDRRKDGSNYPKWLTINVVRGRGDGAVTHYVGVFHDLSQSKIAEERIRQLAYSDPLTGLPNRLLLMDRLGRTLSRAGRKRCDAALLFVDLDRFKNVNDSLGHVLGDMLLKEVGLRLSASVRDSDTVARIGGDEFVVVLEDVHCEADIVTVVRKMLCAFEWPVEMGLRQLYASLSVGIAVFPRDGDDVETLMRHADTAMYQAKLAGPNSYQFFASFMNEAVHERLEIENALYHALQYDEFEVHYQPIIDVNSGRVESAEALIRWRRANGEWVSPGRFIPVAEETGVIGPIGDWVLERVCQDLAAWAAEGFCAPRISVNISTRQFRAPGLIERIGASLKQYGLCAEELELELTEGALMERPEHAVALLHELKAMGLALAIDDFGSGYSSLNYLKSFPIDRLKIDKSFVSDVLEDERDREITFAVIALSHNLGVQVVAEGIEQAEQLALMRSRNCDFAQGFMISRPMQASCLQAFCVEREESFRRRQALMTYSRQMFSPDAEKPVNSKR